MIEKKWRNGFYSVSCGLSAAPTPVGTGNYRYRHQPAPTGQDRHRYLPAQTGLDRPGLFNDVFDKNFENIIPFWAFIESFFLKTILAQNESSLDEKRLFFSDSL
jgi:hypothetical protein